MKEKILTLFEPFKDNPILYVAIIAAIPIVELRGAIPIGVAMGLNPWVAYAVAFAASMIPAPFIIYFFEKALTWLENKNYLKWLTNFLHKKFDKKKEGLGDGRFWAIVIFTAIPLPGTGVWTASGLASLVKMPMKEALTAVALGDLIAGLIVTLITIFGQSVLS